MQIGSGEFTYTWHEHWAKLPDNPGSRDNGRTHGVAVTRQGQVVVFAQANPAVLIYDASGQLQTAWGDRFLGAHGLTLVEEDGVEYLWLTDQNSGEVVKTTLDGQSVLNLERADHDWYKDGGGYSPTWVAVNEERRGGNGDVWVADGYGSSLVHRYSRSGTYLGSISGQKGEPGKFACPHGIAFDYRHGEPELYIADRGNQRVQVYDAEGNYKRVIGARTLHSPCMFHFLDDWCLIPQLFGRVDVLDRDDRVVAMLGDNGFATTQAGWPNHNVTGHPERIRPGSFNSPHGGCFAPNGDIYIVEWIIGGRITKLARQ